jgi:UMF1 family MFS transporter
MQTASPRTQVISWGLWNWGADAYNIVVLTFVFSVYLTSSLFIDPQIVAAYHAAGGAAGSGPAQAAYESATSQLTSNYSLVMVITGLLLAALAPVMGQAADRGGRRKRWLGLYTALMTISCFLLVFVQGQPSFFWIGAILIGAGGIFYELAGVNYNSMLTQISTPATIGRVSGFGWGMGYLGGIVLLLISLVGFVLGDGPYWFGVTSDNGMNIRVIAVLVAVWCVIFTLPVLFTVPENSATTPGDHVGVLESYRLVGRSIARLYRSDRQTFRFLIASMVFRDGLAAVFTFGGILAATVFGFSSTGVILFAVGANVVAGIGVFLGGVLDDRFGSKAVIVTALSVLSLVGLALFFLHDAGPLAFWVGGLVLALCVGPAQSSARSQMARMATPGNEGEIFGLYAMTGKATIFIGSLMFYAFVSLFGATYWGIIGIVLVVLVGLLLLLPVRTNFVRGGSPSSAPGALAE